MADNLSDFDPSTHPHRRYNPLTGEYVLVSPHRTKRPWLGQIEATPSSNLPQYDPSCYLCPGNKRAGGITNAAYENTFVFENDFAAVLPPPGPRSPPSLHPLLAQEPVQGNCDVLIFHPRHDLTLPRMKTNEIIRIIDEWTAVYEKRGRQDGINYIQIFENKGAMMGCSNPHPHGQVWSLSKIPNVPSTELLKLKEFSLSSPPPSTAPKGYQGRPCLLCEYAQLESSISEDSRVVVRNDNWVVVVPWWAVWPFEVLVLPYKRHIPSISDLTPEEKKDFAQIITAITVRYDNLFSCSFPYSMGIHQRPTPRPAESETQDDHDLAHLHLHFSPPLLRSATVRKFLVGFELMSEPQRDLTPEQAAARLRSCAEVHYLDAAKDTTAQS